MDLRKEFVSAKSFSFAKKKKKNFVFTKLIYIKHVYYSGHAQVVWVECLAFDSLPVYNDAPQGSMLRIFLCLK